MRFVSALLWGVVGALGVCVFMSFLDEFEFATIGAAGVTCATLRLVFPRDVFSRFSRRTWLCVGTYLVFLDVSLLLLTFGYLTGKPAWLYTRGVMFVWDALAFPSSVLALVAARFVGGNFGGFAVFAAPTVNTVLLALVTGMVLRRRTPTPAVT